jgi:uncharacterized protein
VDQPLGQEISTPVGPARVLVDGSPERGRLVLGHGAGGGVQTPDLLAARAAGRALGLQVVCVEQPWRVAGRRVAEAPARLDVAWRAVLSALDAGGPLVVGGRSAGARVACRTADELGVAGVLALAFPLVPPGRPERSRADELARPRAPRLVVQGDRDGFGVPPPAPGVHVHVVRGADHSFRVRAADGRTARDVREEVERVVRDWLADLLLPQTLT